MLIVFDMDGTLFDTQKEIVSALNIVLRRKKIQEITDKESHIFLGPPFKSTFPKYRRITESESELITKEFREEYKNNVAQSKPYKGVKETLQILCNAGVKLCIATNKPTLQVNILLREYGLMDYFTITKEDKYDGEKKSNTLLRFKELFPFEEKYFMVGDTEGDLEAAIESGHEFIEASYGYGEFNEKNEFAIEKIEDILEIVEL